MQDPKNKESAAAQLETTNAPAKNSVQLTHKRVETNGITLYYITAGRGPGRVHAWVATKPQ
jgi:hypothetical protein